MTDDAARAETEIVEAMTATAACSLYDGRSKRMMEELLAAARQVEIQVTCATCRGGRRVPHSSREVVAGAPLGSCPDCLSGTRTVRAWDVLAGEGE